jgi:hypothetical protein
MNRNYWQRKLQESEAELDAARTRTQVNEAAKKLQHAKAQLKALEEPATKPKRLRRPT